MINLSGSNHPNLLSVYNKTKKIYDDGYLFRKKKKRDQIYRILRRLSVAIVSLFCIVVIYFMVHFANFRTIYNEANQGKYNIDKAVELLEKHENKSAVYYANLAQNNFDLSLSYTKEYSNNFLVRRTNFFAKQYSDIIYFLSTAKTLSRGVEEASVFGTNLDKVFLGDSDFNNLSEIDKKKILGFIYESAPELFGIKANIDLALSTFNNIEYVGALRPFKNEIQEIGKKIEIASFFIDQQIPMSQVLPSFLGYPNNSRYLIVFQDSSRARASGGEIVAYGVMENELGVIKNFNTFSSQGLDEVAKDKVSVALPLALRKYTEKEKWLFSDANWSPDWPEAAKKIEWFYKEETGDNSYFDGVLAINTDFIKELLVLSGPIKIDNNLYDANNFIRLYETDADKQILGKLITEIKLKLFDQNYTNIFDVFNLLASNLAKKNLILYFEDLNFQQLAEENGWSNEIKDVYGDYLMVVDSNISNKSRDTNISKNIDYKLDQDINGAFADLNINYSNNLSNNENISYKNYVRIYVPRGSELVMVKGFDDGVEILEDLENNKSIFSGIINVEPGKISNLRIYYKLPTTVENTIQQGNYSLYGQKQPGSNVDLFTVDLKFANGIRLYNPTGFNVNLANEKQVHWVTNLLADRVFSVNLLK